MTEAVLKNELKKGGSSYSSYKESEADWLGKIPDHWILSRLKNYVLSPTNKNQSQKRKFIALEHIESSSGRLVNGYEPEMIEDEDSNLFESSDILFGKLRPYLRKYWLAPYPGICSSELMILRPNNQIYIPKYLFYLIQSEYFIALADSSSYGVKMPRTSWEILGAKKLPIPLIEEQYKITKFLDYQIAKLDALIAKKELLIERLQEKRTALINHSVTKGLDSKVQLKDSGIYWIGKIQINSQIKKLKYICSLIKDGTHLPPQRTVQGIPLLSVRNIINGKFVNLDDDSLISEGDFDIIQKSFVVKKDDVLLAIVGATLGKTAIVEDMHPFTIQRSLAILRPKINAINFKYLHYFLESKKFQALLWESIGFSAQPGIYLNMLQNFHCVVPPLPEQIKIVEYLDNETQKIDMLIYKIKGNINLLKEYRAALISA